MLQDILKRYEPACVFNADECGLFYGILPDRAVSLESEKCVGGKKSKELLNTIYVKYAETAGQGIKLINYIS